MEHDIHFLKQRVNRLENWLRMSCLVAGCMSLLFILSFVSAGDNEAGNKILKARGLIIEDEKGQARIVMGSPVPGPKGFDQRRTASTGMVVNDENGYERFGMGIDGEGNMIMGFDAPPDKGHPGNPERIHIVADANGGAFIRFLNQKTEVVSFLRLDENNEFCLEFIDRKTGKIMRRQVRYDGEKTLEWK